MQMGALGSASQYQTSLLTYARIKDSQEQKGWTVVVGKGMGTRDGSYIKVACGGLGNLDVDSFPQMTIGH
jgi:hypothetical protein